MTERLDLRRAALYGAALIGADTVFKAEERYVQDVRRDVLRNVDRRLHRTRRRLRTTATGLEFVLIALVIVAAIVGRPLEQTTSTDAG